MYSLHLQESSRKEVCLTQAWRPRSLVGPLPDPAVEVDDAFLTQVLTCLSELTVDILICGRHSRVDGSSRRVFGHVLAFEYSI